MRNTQKVKEFLDRWRYFSIPSKSLLHDYTHICKNLLYEEEDIVRETTYILNKNIESWAQKNSILYSEFLEKDFIEKRNLLDKKLWFVKGLPSRTMLTSGSTTGSPFSYLRCEEFFDFIECENHYDLIMDEFEIKENPNVLFFLDIGINVNGVIEVRDNPKNFMEKHGLKRKCTVHYANFKEFRSNKENFFKHLIKHVEDHEIDVTLISGPTLNSLCDYLKNSGINIKISKLLSNTNEKLLECTIHYIKENKTFDKICDHMRCWDGGATFFTCKEENYHLMDNLSWCVEKNKRLICTDYFSLSSPFVNYWNGDLCRINEKYERCDCGRLYRDFEFLDNRPFLIKGRNILRIRDMLSSFKQIKEVRCSQEFLEIVSQIELNQEDQKTILDNINNLLNYGEKNERDIIKIKFSKEDYGQNKGQTKELFN